MVLKVLYRIMNTCNLVYGYGTMGTVISRPWKEVRMFGLVVRFTCKDQPSAEAYDRLVAETAEGIRANEPGTLVYATHLVEGQLLQRIFYELYRDKAAFEAHEAAPHTRRYLAERDQYLASTEVDWLTLQSGKGTGG